MCEAEILGRSYAAAKKQDRLEAHLMLISKEGRRGLEP